MAGKLAARAKFLAALNSDGTRNPDSICSTCGGGGGPSWGKAPLPDPLFAEGAGDGGATWTCGPAATRNMVYGMTRGALDYSEATWAYRERTTQSDGTDITNIKGALNYYVGTAWGHWDITAPATNADLVSDVEADVNAANSQSGIQNVDTWPLYFWNGVGALHYDLDYGYNLNHDGIYVGEEWDHEENGGYPYGFREPPVSQDLKAIKASPTHEIVW